VRPVAGPGTWLLAAFCIAAGGVAGEAAGIPGAALLAGLLVGLVVAVWGRRRLSLGRAPFAAGQAVLGVALGTYLQTSTLDALGSHWLPVLAVSAATLGLTVGAGVVLARVTDIDAPTAALGMVAGGASGIVAMSDDLGADDRLVAVMQYLRVLVIVVLTPLAGAVLFASGSSHAARVGGADPGLVADLAFTAGVAVAGVLVARPLRLPAGSLLGPLALAGILALTGASGGARVPYLVAQVAFAVIGLQVGLRFTRESLRQVARLLPWVMSAIAALIVACALLALALSQVAGISFLDAYLATTPGGLYAVIATAVSTGANTTFVLAVQSLRLIVMIAAAPAIVRWLAGPRRSVPE
jgi:membrane AbrB-like protein